MDSARNTALRQNIMSIEIEGDSISPSASSTTEVINQLVETAKQRRQIIENLQSELSDIRDELATRAKRNAKHRKRISEQEDKISEQEERISELEDKTEGNTDGSQSSEKQPSTDKEDESDDQSTALEQVCALPEETAMNSLSANQKRARSVARRIKDYGKSVPAGVAITSTRIRDILSGLEDKRVHRQTVQRVADFLKRFGDGEIERKETRGGKDVVVFSESIVEAITSVVTGNKDPGVTPAII
jgi:hypothetical protein